MRRCASMGWGRPRRPALLAAGVAALPTCGCFALTSKYVGEAHTRCSTLVLYSVLRTDRIHALCEVYGSPRSCEELDRPFLTDGSVCVRALHRARLETVAHGYDIAPPFPALRCCDPFFLASRSTAATREDRSFRTSLLLFVSGRLLKIFEGGEEGRCCRRLLACLFDCDRRGCC